MTQERNLQRREFVKLAVGSVAVTSAFSQYPVLADGHLAKLDEGDPQAAALSYKHDATQTDASTQAKYEPGQLCKNRNLYQGGSDKEWVPCAIFPGKEVNANGWCSAYIAMAS